MQQTRLFIRCIYELDAFNKQLKQRCQSMNIEQLKQHFQNNRTIVILTDNETKVFNIKTASFSLLEATINKMIVNGKQIKGRVL